MMKPLWILLICICNNALAAASTFLLNCEDSSEPVVVEGVDQPSCFCYGPGDNRTTFIWTFVHHNGQRQTLGTCYGAGNCISSFDPSDLTVSMQLTYSSLNILNLTSQFSGVVTCTQTNRTFYGSVSTEIKTARVRINDCDGGTDINEGEGGVDISCDHSPYTPNTVTWTIITHSQKSLDMGSCRSSDNNNCTSLLGPNVTLNGDSSHSDILFKNVDRDMATAVCSVSFSDSFADNCTLNIYNPSTVQNCSVGISLSNWSFIVSCDVTNVYSSDGRYEMMLAGTFDLLKADHVVTIDVSFFDLRSFRQFLEPYTDATNNRTYYRGHVVHFMPMFPYPGTYNTFRVDTYHGAGTDIIPGDVINISLPVRPTHNCSDVTTPCSCSTETLGSPAGRLLWLVGNTTVAVGDYGVNQLWLPSDNLPDGQDVMVATCQLDWIQPLNAQEPVILRRTDNGRYKMLTIVMWSLLSAVIVFLLIIVFNVVRRGRFSRLPCTTSAREDEDAEPRSYARF